MWKHVVSPLCTTCHFSFCFHLFTLALPFSYPFLLSCCPRYMDTKISFLLLSLKGKDALLNLENECTESNFLKVATSCWVSP